MTKNSSKGAVPKKRWLLPTIVGAVIVLAAGGAITYKLTARVTPPDPKKDPQAAAKFIASDDFKRLSETERRAFLNNMGSDRRRSMQGLSDEERRKAAQNMRREREREMDQRVRAFFKKSPEEQNAQLDADLARMKEMRARWEQQRQQPGNNQQANRQGGSGGPQPGNNQQANRQGGSGGPQQQGRPQSSPQQRRDRYEASNPADSAMRRAYFQKLRERAQATGQPLSGPGGRR